MSSKEDKPLLKLTVYENAQSSFEKEFSTDTEIRVGRSEDCILVLRSRRVSREHCRIYYQDDSWHIEDLNSQNGTKVNGQKISSLKLNHKDEIQVSNYRIEVFWQPIPDADSTQVNEDDRTVVLNAADDSDRTIVSPQLPHQAIADQNIAERIKDVFLRNKILSGVAASVFLIFVIILILPGSDQKSDDEDPISAEIERAEKIHDMETLHRINSYLQSGTNQLEAGNYSEALVRFQAVLEIDPQNQTAIEQLTRTRQKIVQAEEARRQALEEEQRRMDRIRAITSQARQAKSRGELSQAKDIIAEAVFLDPDEPNVLKLQEEIEKAIAQQQVTREQKEQQRMEMLANLRQHFDQGQRYYDQEEYVSALREWEKVLEFDLDTPESVHTRHALPQLRKLLEEDVEDDYNRAMKYYDDNDYTRALTYLNKVILVSPEYREVQRLMNETFVRVESKARRLYQEGLVFEGLGQRDRAMEKWREVLKVMPIEENDYYQRAMDKLR